MIACFVALLALSAGHARADAANDQAIAADLFDKGVKKREAGKCDKTPVGDVALCNEARDLFKRSYALSPSALGTLRNLAYVEKSLGLVASASRHFRELARKAPLDPKPERQLWAKFATQEAEALEPRVPHLTLKVPKDRPADLTIMLDEESLAAAAWGTSLDVDPGEHAIKASGKGIKPFAGSVTLAEKDDKSIDVQLEPDATATVEPPKEPKVDPPPKPVTSAAPASSGSTPPAAKDESPPSRVAPLVVTGLGVVGVGVGLGLGAMAKSKRDGACNTTTKLCEPDGLDSAKSLASMSTIVTSIGGAALVGGLIWFLVTPSGKSGPKSAWSAPFVARDGGGVVAAGSF